MYVKLRNVKLKKDFVVSSRSADHYKDDKNIVYLGKCEVDGTITLLAADDLEWQKKTLAEQLEIVNLNVKKKTVATARHRGDPDNDIEDENQNSYNTDDED